MVNGQKLSKFSIKDFSYGSGISPFDHLSTQGPSNSFFLFETCHKLAKFHIIILLDNVNSLKLTSIELSNINT